MIQFLWLTPLGFLVGAFGTLIGAGGGFILVPILLLLYPDKSPDTITSISLAVVFFNALSGSFAYSRMKRIDYKSGIIFAIATLPGSILGSVITSYVPRQLFNGIFGVLLVIISVFLILRIKNEKVKNTLVIKNGYITRTVVDIEGVEHTFLYNPVTGIVVSIFVGFMSSFLGIGGGIIHVPVLVNILNYPVHIATATSHFVLAVMSLSGTMVHIVNGVLQSSFIQTAALSIGVLFGAQLGAKLSKKIHGVAIIRSLAVALAIVGVRIFIMAF
ncbi:sulfite exporter TauE/SafE family protein [Clostridium beijerinckii]|uniref:sulfite exporter TauE/SafE family protein n=1 Tax=Clostridium beijerinckii TaxID=1520 RepID=UPI001494FEB6|nr:sulfite exporter TauE/SafE family protein [Clostridium beijerinckii]NYC02275.1 putative membrane protein YfcA [Clostridium beijerinckii]